MSHTDARDAGQGFPDGIGRVGRALIQAMLRGGDLTRSSVTVPVSAGLLHNTSGYFDTLDAYRSGHIEPIVRCLVDASFAAVANGRSLVRDLEAVRERWRTEVKARRDSAVHRLLDFFCDNPW